MAGLAITVLRVKVQLGLGLGCSGIATWSYRTVVENKEKRRKLVAKSSVVL